MMTHALGEAGAPFLVGLLVDSRTRQVKSVLIVILVIVIVISPAIYQSKPSKLIFLVFS